MFALIISDIDDRAEQKDRKSTFAEFEAP